MDEEVTLFCKVKRVLSEDEEINLFDVIGNIENAFELNREQKENFNVIRKNATRIIPKGEISSGRSYTNCNL